MGRKTKGVIRERKDYTGLLLELQGQSPSPPPQPAADTSEHKTPYSPYRQRIMSDEAVKYLYSKRGGPFHDKSCPKAQHIPDEELGYSEKYLSNISQCPLCAVKAYVRLGAKDFYNYPLYEKLFQRMRFTPVLLRRMYVNEKMRTSASSNGLTIWGGGGLLAAGVLGWQRHHAADAQQLLPTAGWNTDIHRRIPHSGRTSHGKLRVYCDLRLYLCGPQSSDAETGAGTIYTAS